ncbi:tripartite motif-containing protein 2-like [Anneissia japonica]|uniref:tripartite motif-containing protein 2-like n=1 Tax=Anneissia japonica TaxID=1529436 RepID=UPI0014258250|nr:tripartite motif-containing protein 2-like [Anneissia japonica]
MAENEIQQSLADSNRCPICLNVCQELKTLICQHSFCILCLEDWIKKKGALECPNCRQSHPVPEGGLQLLPSNTIGVLSADNLDRGHDNIKCCCGKCNAVFYCQDCNQYLCTSCTNTHEKFPALKNHILQKISANWPEKEPEPLCPLHEKVMELYCNICKIPICQNCVITDHKEDEGKHETIEVSEAFNYFKVTATALISQANVNKLKAQRGITKCIENDSELSKSRNDIIEDINNSVEEIVKLVRETGKALEETFEDVCKAKKEKSNSQIHELKSYISCLEEKQDCIGRILNSGKLTALQTCQQPIIELQEKIDLPDTEPRDDGKVYFSPTKDHIMSSLKKQGLGSFFEKPNENVFQILCENPLTVTNHQTFHVEIAQRYKCKIDINDLTLSERTLSERTLSERTLSERTLSERSIFRGRPKLRFSVIRDNLSIFEHNGKYFVKGSFGKEKILDIKFRNSPIKGSPIMINVKEVGIERVIENVGLSTCTTGHNKGIQDLVMSEKGWFLIVCNTDGAFRFEKSGAFVSKIILPKDVKTVRKLKNNNLIFSSTNTTSMFVTKHRSISNNSILTVCRHNGKVIKSLDLTAVNSLTIGNGIDVNEDLNLVYVPDQKEHCVHVYNMESKLKVKSIGSEGGLEGQMNGPSDVAVTKEGNLIVADTQNHRLQLFGSDGQFIKVIIGGGLEVGMVIKPSRVGIDYDDNIIVASECKVQLFDNCGKFIRVIHEIQNKETYFAFSIVSHFPRRLALAEIQSRTIKLINY